MAANESTYVLDVKLNEDNEIFKFSYSTKWNDISLMLLLKYDCEGYWFSFTDKDDMLKVINNQDDFNEALKFCANNFDVLNVQMWSPDMPKEDLNKKKEQQQPDTSVDGDESGEPRSSQYLIVAGKAIGGIGNLASGVVKSATNYFSPSAPSTPEATNEDPKADVELEDMSPSTSSSKPNIPERPTVDSSPPQVKDDTIKPQQHEEDSTSEEKAQSKCEEKDAGEDVDSIKDEKPEPTTTELELVERIKQEVQSAVRMELQAIREELTQLVVAKQQGS